MKNTDTADMGQVSLTPPIRHERTRETHLLKFLKRHVSSRLVFACAGEAKLWSKEIAAFQSVDGSTEVGIDGTQRENISCLLIDASNLEPLEVDGLLLELGNVTVLLLCIDPSRKKTPYYAVLEAHGFRIDHELINVTYLYRESRSTQVISSDHRFDEPDVQEKLQDSSRRIRNLPEKTRVEFVSVAGRDLVTPERFDIAIKSHYGRLYKKQRARDWREHVYYEHILRITGPGQDVNEHDGSGKQGLDKFFASFHGLLGDVAPESVPWVPVDRDFVAFDGAHRIAAAIVNQRTVRCARLEATSGCVARRTFFERPSNGHPPCPQEILDEAALEYCRVKDGLAIALIFPTVASDSVAMECLKEVGEVVCRKDLVLSPGAGGALLRQVYLGHSWLEESGRESGFAYKQRSCFPFSGPLRVLLLDRFNPRMLRPAKERIRAAYGVGNHSIHVTDGDEETLRVARLVFNQNSVDLLNFGCGTLPDFHRKLFSYRSWLEDNDLDEEDFCVDGSAVLSLLGLRECRDLDFLYVGNPADLPDRPKGIDCHNDVARYHGHTISDIVGDPRLHCWYMGVKFCTPRLVHEMKRRRGEPKDRRDVVLLRSRLPFFGFKWTNKMLAGVVRAWGYVRARLAPGIRRLKSLLRPLVRRIRRR